MIIVCEPFLLDDELKTKCIEWVKWANSVEPREYDPFYRDGIDRIKQEAEEDRITASGIGQAFNPD